MNISIQRTLLNKTSLKITAACIGCMFWSFFSSLHNHTRTITVPLCFYSEHNLEQNCKAPDTITLTLSASKHDLNTIDLDSLAVHVNADRLKWGPNPLIITHKNLFLPQRIKVLDYTPTNLTVTKCRMGSK